MTASEVVFDTWAWWEVLHGTDTGRRIAQTYVEAPGVRLHTSAITFGEVSAKLHALGAAHKVRATTASIAAFSDVHDVTPELAEEAGRLRQELRRTDPNASLADGLVLATARSLGAKLVSADGAFAGQPDVAGV